MSENKSLDQLVHDVSSKCASLKSAAAILRGASDEERRELLTLMAEQARSLSEILGRYKP